MPTTTSRALRSPGRPSLRTTARRAGVAVLLVATAAAPLLTTGPASADRVASRAGVVRPALSAGWLDGQLTDRTPPADGAQPSDFVSMTSGLLALDRLGGHDATVDSGAATLANRVHEASESPSGETLSENSARLLLVAQAAGLDPTDFGGVDLVSRLEQHVSTYQAMNGRLRDGLHYGDGVDVVGQADAVRGLAAAGSSSVAPMIGFLLQQQCDAGWFRLQLDEVYAPDQGCRAGAGEPDVAATADAVLALRAARASATADQRTAIQDAVRSARAWLLSVQRRGGGFAADPTDRTQVGDTVATAAAEQLLRSAGRPLAANRAQRWLHQVQLPTGPDAGALAPNLRAATAARRAGIPDAQRDVFAETTALAAPGLVRP